MAILFYVPVGFSHVFIYEWPLPGCLFALVIKNVLWLEWMRDECTWHHKTFLVQSEYWHLAIKLYCYACFPLNIRSSVSHSLSVWMPLWAFGYVVTDCTCIGTSLDPRFSLSFSVSVSGYIIILYIDCFYIALFSALEQTHWARMWFFL